VIGLETAEFQIDRFDKMPDAMQEQMLRSTLTEIDAQGDELKTMIAAWQRGDVTALEKSVRGSFAAYPAAYTSLIAERNRNWIPQLQTCLTRTTPCFVVVGAAHMVGTRWSAEPAEVEGIQDRATVGTKVLRECVRISWAAALFSTGP
jgi:uncharacterized protein YbaP (TraB family)